MIQLVNNEVVRFIPTKENIIFKKEVPLETEV